MRYPVLNLGVTSWQLLQPYGGWGAKPSEPPPTPPGPPSNPQLDKMCAQIVNVWKTARSGTSDQKDAEKAMQDLIGSYPAGRQQDDAFKYLRKQCPDLDFWTAFLIDYPYQPGYQPPPPYQPPTPQVPPYSEGGRPPVATPPGRWPWAEPVRPRVETPSGGGTPGTPVRPGGGGLPLTTPTAAVPPPVMTQGGGGGGGGGMPQMTTPITGAGGGRTPVATQGAGSNRCPPGQFWDGMQCRGSISPQASSLISAAGGLGPSGGGGAPVGTPTGGYSPAGITMKGIPVLNLGRRW